MTGMKSALRVRDSAYGHSKDSLPARPRLNANLSVRLSLRYLPVRDLNHRVEQCGPHGGWEDFLSQIRIILPAG